MEPRSHLIASWSESQTRATKEKSGDTAHVPQGLGGARAVSLWDLHQPYCNDYEAGKRVQPFSSQAPHSCPSMAAFFKGQLSILDFQKARRPVPANLILIVYFTLSFTSSCIMGSGFYYYMSCGSWHITDPWSLTKLWSGMNGWSWLVVGRSWLHLPERQIHPRAPA